MIVVIYYLFINFVFRGPLGRILHTNWCHPLKIKVIKIIIKPHGPVSYSLTFHVFDTNFLPVPPSILSSKYNKFSFAISKRREMRQLQVNRLQKFDARRANIKDATGKSLAFIKRR